METKSFPYFLPLNVGDIGPEPAEWIYSDINCDKERKEEGGEGVINFEKERAIFLKEIESNEVKSPLELKIKEFEKKIGEGNLENYLKNILEDIEKFYEDNEIIKLNGFSPEQRFKIGLVERKIEGFDKVVGNISKIIGDLNRFSIPFLKCLEGFFFEMQALMDLFINNQELNVIICLVNENIRHFKIEMEKFFKNINIGINE